jgi:hypothetical protein
VNDRKWRKADLNLGLLVTLKFQDDLFCGQSPTPEAKLVQASAAEGFQIVIAVGLVLNGMSCVM